MRYGLPCLLLGRSRWVGLTAREYEAVMDRSYQLENPHDLP
jgi:hypothetical protein